MNVIGWSTPLIATAPTPALSGLPGLLLAAGVLLLLVVTWSSLRKKLRKAAEHRPDARERIAQIRARERAHTHGRESLEEVMVSSEELARRLAAHMDAKASRLERLIQDAERVIGELDRRTGAAAQRPASTRLPSAFDPPREERTDTDPAVRKIYRLADEGRQPLEIASMLEEQVGKVELVLALREA